jgi:hypothetical protein
MVGARSRNRTHKSSVGGTAKRQPLNINFASPTSSVITDYEYTEDSTEAPPYNAHSLSKYRTYIDPPYVNGSCAYTYSTGGTVQFTNYATANRTLYANVPNVSVVSHGYWKTKAIANLNPSRPPLDVPLYLFELREFPRMLRDLGRVLEGTAKAGDVAGGHLAYQFGWRPLVQDLQTLGNYLNHSAGHLQYLAGLTKGRRIKRTLLRNHLLVDTLVTDGYQQFNVGPSGSPWGVVADIMTREYCDIWFTCYSKSNSPQISLKDPPTSWARYAHSRGLSLRPTTLWNATPWTWLLDYFGNLGDVVEASEGLSQMKIVDMCLMVRQRVTSRLERVRLKPGLSLSQNFMTREVKARSVDPTPTPSMGLVPWITRSQGSILASLVTASALRAYSRSH